MSALAAKPVTWADPLAVFRARAEARATLWQSGDIEDLHEAVDALQAAAVASGLVAAIGQDAVQGIIADAFGKVPRPGELEAAFAELAEALEWLPKPRPAVPKSTIDAAEYLVRLGDRARLHKWLQAHSIAERTAILKHLEAM